MIADNHALQQAMLVMRKLKLTFAKQHFRSSKSVAVSVATGSAIKTKSK